VAAQTASRHGRPGRDRLTGRIEVDETFTARVDEGTRGRHAGRKTLIVIAAQEDGSGIGRIRMLASRTPRRKACFRSYRKPSNPEHRPHGWMARLSEPDSRHRGGGQRGRCLAVQEASVLSESCPSSSLANAFASLSSHGSRNFCNALNSTEFRISEAIVSVAVRYCGTARDLFIGEIGMLPVNSESALASLMKIASSDCLCRQSVGAPIRRPSLQRIPQNLHSHPRYGIS
jgi:hypothetical protein